LSASDAASARRIEANAHPIIPAVKQIATK
jgi:hypothetical protein